MSDPPTLARHLALHTVAIAGIGLLALGLAGCSQEPDQPQTLAELRAEAEAGDAGSLWMLGSRYQFVDDAEAVTWYRKAAEQGPALAQASLGEMYKLGRGVPQDTAEAAAWYCKAAAAYSFIEDDISECAELSEEASRSKWLIRSSANPLDDSVTLSVHRDAGPYGEIERAVAVLILRMSVHPECRHHNPHQHSDHAEHNQHIPSFGPLHL